MVQNYRYVIAQYAQTSLRDVTGRMTLDQLLVEREQNAKTIETHVEKDTKGWELEVTRLRIQDVDVPEELGKMMTRQASAAREVGDDHEGRGGPRGGDQPGGRAADDGREPGRRATADHPDDRRPGPDGLEHRRERRADRADGHHQGPRRLAEERIPEFRGFSGLTLGP